MIGSVGFSVLGAAGAPNSRHRGPQTWPGNKEDISRDHLKAEKDQILHEGGDSQMKEHAENQSVSAGLPPPDQYRRKQLKKEGRRRHGEPENHRHVVQGDCSQRGFVVALRLGPNNVLQPRVGAIIC